MSDSAAPETLLSTEQLELVEDVATFVNSMIAVAVYFMCALVDAPFWAFGWLLVIPLWQGARFILR